jgi:hypothetical protein
MYGSILANESEGGCQSDNERKGSKDHDGSGVQVYQMGP